jgi:hypothetical protein
VDISITIRGHGEFSSETLVREERPLIFSLMTSGDLKELPVSMQLLLPQAIFKKPGFNDNVVSFFTQDIGNPSICSDLLEFHIGLNETKIKLLKLLISRNNDASLGQHYLLSLYIQLVDANMEKFYEEAKTAAKEGVNSLHPVSQGLALDLWKALLEKDQGFKALDFQDAIFAATKGENNSNRFVWDSALNLWKALVEKVQGVKEPELKKQVFEGAIAAATKVMNKLKHVVRKSVLDLWKALVEKVQGVQDQVLKKQGFDKAIDAARDGMHSFHPEVQISALDLWKALFENGEGLADAQDYLSKMSDTNYFKKAFEQLINEYKPKFEQASLANIVPAGLQPAVAAQVPAA